MKQTVFRIGAAITVVATLLSVISWGLPTVAQAQTPQPDPYEPDELDPPWIGNDEVQARSFYPDGDLDKARFRVKAGHWYDVHTQNLAPLVDTALAVELEGAVYKDDDGGPEPLASRITFQAPDTGDALITIVNSQGVYSTSQTYELYTGEIAAPTPVPTLTPTPTLTATSTPTSKPTRTPAPTATPARPLISFSASPDHTNAPGECVTLRWSVERASEVYLVYPSGSQEGVIGQEERQVCPLQTSTYALKVLAPGGDETVEVQVSVAPPTPTPTAAPTRSPGSVGGSQAGKGTAHVAVYVDENRSEVYDPQEGVLGALATLMSQADPGRLWTAATDELGQAHFSQVPAGSYTLLIPHLGHAEAVAVRGEDLTVDVLVPPIQLPSRIP